MGDVSMRLNAQGKTIDEFPAAEKLAALIHRIVDGTLSNKGAKEALDYMVLWSANSPGVDGVIEKLGLKQMSDSAELSAIVDEVLAANAKSVEEYRAGKDKAFNMLVGRAMKASKGKANPTQVNELLKKKLG